MAPSLYNSLGKRWLELLVVVVAAPVWVPVLVVIGGLVWLVIGRPVFFVQERLGTGGRVFRLVKFRTMTDERDEHGRLLPDNRRLHGFGRWLRSTSLDEFPELLNVLRGDMSLVGPRPLLPQYLRRYNRTQARRHEIKPGITGWCQINGRNALGWQEKFSLDVWYVDHVSFWLDVRILATTMWTVLKRDGISQSGHATMEEFQGSLVIDDDRPKG